MNLRIDRWTYGGSGLASAPDGSALAVPFTLPGELLDDTRLTVIEPSPHRVPPQCQHFGTCGGCHYQHADYPTQVRLKQGILRDLLAQAGLLNLPEAILHTAGPWLYRNRIRLRFALVEGQLRAGYNRPGSYDFLPIRECPISAPILLRAAEAIVVTATASPAWSAQLTEAELFTTPDQSRLQLTLFVRSAKGLALASLCAALTRLVPELTGAGVVIVGTSGKQERPGEIWGAPGLSYPAADRDYWVPRGSFFQVNRFLVDDLVHLVTAGRTGTLAWDLYAGVGLFTRALLDSFTAVTSVEVAAPPGTTGIKTTTLDFLRHAVLQRDRPSLIVMDPPRAGIGLEVCAVFARVAAPEMVYVSCDPTTLARDLRALVDSGYTIAELHLVDLFPQTFHLETVVVLHR